MYRKRFKPVVSSTYPSASITGRLSAGTLRS